MRDHNGKTLARPRYTCPSPETRTYSHSDRDQVAHQGAAAVGNAHPIQTRAAHHHRSQHLPSSDHDTRWRVRNPCPAIRHASCSARSAPAGWHSRRQPRRVDRRSRPAHTTPPAFCRAPHRSIESPDTNRSRCCCRVRTATIVRHQPASEEFTFDRLGEHRPQTYIWNDPWSAMAWAASKHLASTALVST